MLLWPLVLWRSIEELRRLTSVSTVNACAPLCSACFAKDLDMDGSHSKHQQMHHRSAKRMRNHRSGQLRGKWASAVQGGGPEGQHRATPTRAVAPKAPPRFKPHGTISYIISCIPATLAASGDLSQSGPGSYISLIVYSPRFTLAVQPMHPHRCNA